MRSCALIRTGWREPAEALGPHAGAPFCLALLSGGEGEADRWSYLARDPDRVFELPPGGEPDPFAALGDLLGEALSPLPDGPAFQGGVAGLVSYELGARAEGIELPRSDFPDAVFARYPAVLAFDHRGREVIAVGRGPDDAAARLAAERALSWLAPAPAPRIAGPLSAVFESDDGPAYERGAAEVVRRIGAGEIFQANIARRWLGRLSPGARPFDVAARLAAESPAPFAGYLRLNGRSLVTNSPERFLKVETRGGRRIVETRPIKGTARRGGTEAEDAALAEALAASPKDRAENLMIVDLMRNDLSRVCRPGEVTAPDLFRVETFANVHHLVSTVRGVLDDGVGAPELLAATMPPGSITGAPKVQAMKVIAELEPPRGAFFGSLFWAGFDGAFDANVLIRTLVFAEDETGWTFEARAGGGIVADSDPAAERAETEAKIAALRRALTEPGSRA